MFLAGEDRRSGSRRTAREGRQVPFSFEAAGGLNVASLGNLAFTQSTRSRCLYG